MSTAQLRAAPSDGVLPIRGTRDEAPSSIMIRSALAEGGITDGGIIRTGVAIVFALADELREQGAARGPVWTSDLARTYGWMAVKTSLPAPAIRTAVDALLRSGVLEGSGESFRISVEVVAELPALARLDVIGIRDAVELARGRLAPCLAVVRELAKRPINRAGWIEYSIPELTAETLFGRTAVCDALATLERARTIDRAPTAGGSGILRARIAPQPHSPIAAAPTPPAVPAAQGYVLSVGGARLKVGAGLTAAVALDPDGTIVVSVDQAP